MHIGFDISQTGVGKAGCGYFADAMAGAMISNAPQHRFSFYSSFGDSFFDYRMPLLNPYRAANTNYGPRHLTREAARKFWSRDKLEAALNDPDIIHSNNFWLPTQVMSSRLIYTLYDLGFVIDPSWSTERNRLRCFDGLFKSSLVADWIVAISEYSRASYLKTFPHFPEERIRVVYPCSRFTNTTQSGKRPEKIPHLGNAEFWLSVGTIEPRKNQRLLVKAYADYLAAGGRPMPLVLAGGMGWMMKDFSQYVAELGVADKVILLGYVSDAELIWLYRNCYAHLYPSVFEGFGLPVLEGMQFGAPTLCSNTTSLPEVAGDAAMLISPASVGDWVDAMRAIADSAETRQTCAAAARQQASKFDRNRSATAVLHIYREAISLPKRISSRQTSTLQGQSA